MKRGSLDVALGDRSYTISIGEGIVADMAELLPFRLSGRRAFILTDAHVAPLHGDSARRAVMAAGAESAEILSLEPGEQTKSFARLEDVLAWLLKNRADRKSVLVALGGGVIGDLGGLAAALVLRGIPFMQIPTTLLAQVDSSVGGKTGINTAYGKNLVGAFYQPFAVLCDLSMLKTLPRREILAGYAEIAKYGLLGDGAFFEWLETEGQKVCALDAGSLARAVETSCRMKAEIVGQDEREQGRRALLNLGHTFGHAIEAEAAYDGRVLHGEAVAIGMTLAFRLSSMLGLCAGRDADRVERHLRAIGLPVAIRDIRPALGCSADDLVAHMDHDKKAEGGKPVFILANGIGRAFVARDVDMDAVRAVIEDSF